MENPWENHGNGSILRPDYDKYLNKDRPLAEIFAGPKYPNPKKPLPWAVRRAQKNPATPPKGLQVGRAERLRHHGRARLLLKSFEREAFWLFFGCFLMFLAVFLQVSMASSSSSDA